jgi:hypothetical protein
MAEYYGVTTFAAPPSADTSINNVATTTNVQVDAVAYAALQQSLAGNYVARLSDTGAYTYNTDGSVASTPDGTTYAYNPDGTLHSQTLNGVTRTYTYNTDGTIASVA